ncbi:protein kinase domain-containing protein [Roseimaritima ulvae]|uniref:Serine/threonine-protein kinase PrkC n=1 Tax=Roseimaritima ulvae TaxID=980254 RepID=A0A5B9QUZ3_9BACT|nr:protein kinase [Roseimaritima ulvae]QEG41175.1 Serine/threonine-protein kinase PrkC [Roseimaritima ulvae]
MTDHPERPPGSSLPSPGEPAQPKQDAGLTVEHSESMEDVPSSFGRYRVTGFLGQGGFGSVFRGYDAQLQRAVAIKVPEVDVVGEKERERFRDEARHLAQLQHPGIVSVFDVGADEQHCFIVTELLPGLNLHDWLLANRPDWIESVEVVIQIAEALSHAHSRRVIHRDVKPANVLICPDRGPVLVDFGLALATANQGDEIGSVRGTMTYMSPEQIEGRAHRVDGRTDLYSLGVVLYQMLCGFVPFAAEKKRELRRQILQDEPQPPRQINTRIPPALEKVCLKALSKSPSKRFTTALDFAEQLRAILPSSNSGMTKSTSDLPFSEEGPASKSESLISTGALAGRRQVTVVHFSPSVVALDGRGEMDPEDQIDGLRRFQRLCKEAIAQLQGSLLPSGGQEVLACFGFPTSFEDAPSRAVQAALVVQDAVAELNAELRTGYQMAVVNNTSVHSGTVIVSSDDPGTVVGEAITLVAKLERYVDPGSLVVSGQTRELVTRYFDCQPLADQPSIPGGTRLYTVTPRTDLSTIGTTDDSAWTPLVGRQQEVDLLTGRWELACEGNSQIVLLIGEAGLGKSRLLHVMRTRVADEITGGQDRMVVEWRCSPFHQSSGFFPVRESFQALLGFERHASDADKLDRLEQHLGELGLATENYVPLFAALLSIDCDSRYAPLQLSSARQKEWTLEALSQWLSALCSLRPVMLIVEDLHWVDPSTLELLTLLAGQPGAESFLGLFTFRPEFTPPWPSSTQQTQIALQRLTRSQIEQIVSCFASDLPRGVVDRIVEHTDGVPLFVEEVTKMMTDIYRSKEDTVGQIPESTIGSRSHSVSIPPTLQALLAARLERLSGDLSVVRTAAALGREFSYPMLAASGDLPDQRLQLELDKLVQDQLIFRRGVPPDCHYTFKHALLQDAVYDGMLKRERREIHGRIADALLNQFQDVVTDRPELVAYHLTEADRISAALEYWAIAGNQATERGQFVEAVSHLELATELLTRIAAGSQTDALEYRLNVPLGISTLSLKGYAAPELGGIYDRRMELCRSLGDSMGELHALWAQGSFRIVRDETDICLQIARRIVAKAQQMENDGATMEALFIRAIVLFYRGDFRASLADCKNGWQLYDPERCVFHMSRTGQHAGVAHLAYMSLNLWHLGFPRQAERRMQQSLQLAETLNHPFMLAFALHHASWLAKCMQQAEQAIAYGERLMHVADEQAFFFWETTGMLFSAAGLAERGDAIQASERLQSGLDRYAMTGAALSLPQYHGYLAEAALQLGDGQQAETSLIAAAQAMQSSKEFYHRPEIQRLQARLAVHQGQLLAAQEHLRSAIENARQSGAASLERRCLTDLLPLLAGEEQAAAKAELDALETRLEAAQRSGSEDGESAGE